MILGSFDFDFFFIRTCEITHKPMGNSTKFRQIDSAPEYILPLKHAIFTKKKYLLVVGWEHNKRATYY